MNRNNISTDVKYYGRVAVVSFTDVNGYNFDIEVDATSSVLPPTIEVQFRPPALKSPEPETILVGVVFGRKFDTPQEAAAAAQLPGQLTYIYKALKRLKLTIGDRVVCPVGPLNQRLEVGEKTGTVVSFPSRESGFYTRTIMKRPPREVAGIDGFWSEA